MHPFKELDVRLCIRVLPFYYNLGMFGHYSNNGLHPSSIRTVIWVNMCIFSQLFLAHILLFWKKMCEWICKIVGSNKTFFLPRSSENSKLKKPNLAINKSTTAYVHMRTDTKQWYQRTRCVDLRGAVLWTTTAEISDSLKVKAQICIKKKQRLTFPSQWIVLGTSEG